MSLFLYLYLWRRCIRSEGDLMRKQQEYLVVFEHAKNHKYASFYEIAATFVTAVILLLAIFAFVVRPVSVSGSSMVPTLSDKDWLLISQSTSAPERGDIIVVNDTAQLHEPIIKRVIAVEGDTIDIDYETSSVTINGSRISEPYILEEMDQPSNRSLLKLPLTVPDGYVFVMGDNRNISLDSRYTEVGLIDVREIQGRAVGRVFPLGHWSIY